MDLLKYFIITNGIVPEEEFKKSWIIKTRVIAIESIPLHEVAVIPVPKPVLDIGRKEIKEAANYINYYNQYGWDMRMEERESNYLLTIDWSEVFDEVT